MYHSFSLLVWICNFVHFQSNHIFLFISIIAPNQVSALSQLYITFHSLYIINHPHLYYHFAFYNINYNLLIQHISVILAYIHIWYVIIPLSPARLFHLHSHVFHYNFPKLYWILLSSFHSPSYLHFITFISSIYHIILSNIHYHTKWTTILCNFTWKHWQNLYFQQHKTNARNMNTWNTNTLYFIDPFSIITKPSR